MTASVAVRGAEAPASPEGARPGAWLRTTDEAAVRTIVEFLDDMSFEYVSAYVCGGSLKLFHSDFFQVQSTLETAAPFFRLVMTLLCQGHQVEDRHVRAWIPGPVLDACLATGLLTRDSQGRWQTPGVCLVAYGGLYLVVSLPPHYFTHTAGPTVPFGVESVSLVAAYVSRVRGRSVLDANGGNGLHATLAAARGAKRACALERDETRARAVAFNAALNGVGRRVTVRQSVDASRDSGRFDLVLAAAASAPMPAALQGLAWEYGGDDGMAQIGETIESLTDFIDERGEAIVACYGLGGFSSINLNRELLPELAARRGVEIRAIVQQKLPMASHVERVEGLMLRVGSFGLRVADRKRAVREWLGALADRRVPADFVYTQLLRIRRSARPATHYIPTYAVVQSDPLLRTVGSDR